MLTFATGTTEARNQSVPLEDYDAFGADRPLVEALRREGAAWAEPRAHALGALAGSAELLAAGRDANRHRPELQAFDRYGHRIDEVVYHPAYHRFMALAVEHELHSLPWRPAVSPTPAAEPGDRVHRGTCSDGAAHVARAAMFMTLSRTEPGHGCPISMTYSAIPALRAAPELAAEWEPRITATSYEPRLDPPGAKSSAIVGMAMTEKQGGSDVRANITVAEPADGAYRLTGHKWFCSAPMSDLFLVLAQTSDGLSCFAMPRITPDGARNAMRIQRLKDKLGNWSNASSEIELHGAFAQMVGEPGRGVPTIIEMVGHTRLDCVLGSTAGMRTATEQAIHHARHRAAFGKLLVEQPLMRNVLADLAIESEAATVTAMRLARAYDESGTDEAAVLFKRLATAVAKYWICKRGPGHAAEALECLGGNGYVEEWPLARVYREQPLLSVWEGSGNVIALDVLRALARTPAALGVFFDEVGLAAGADARLDAHVAALKAEFADPAELEARARRVVERMALALQGSLLVRHSPPEVADAFCATRLAGDGGLAYGTLPAGLDAGAIVERHAPDW
ncbi:acyl-CoA dehydrogenase family protein [Capillimicrobium parvum]|uniref:Acyl-CoA dehydrogenase AidB n=1 Tax=Capillimicrobium parvum TaxID=2884022 RepID=A0A9E7BZK3_9ACTN|nr:acyl-CoA dehydrogenase family protein [Capillimicrobium parvum]UGS34572.1 Putative acyl-CoA dehydrogenase AidB [Capillimicrobium parvum]